MTCDKKLICENWNAFSRFWVGLGGIALGVGTLFLGLAAFWKANEIYDVVSRIKDLTEMVSSIKDIEDQNSRILSRIDKQIEFISKNYAIKFADNNENTKPELMKLLKSFSPSEDTSVSSEPIASAKRIVRLRATTDTLQNEDEIFNHWASFKTSEQRIEYLSKVFEKYLKSGKLEPQITNNTDP